MVACAGLSGVDSRESTPTGEQIPFPTPTLALPQTPSLPVPDTGWETLRPGLERRILQLADEDGRVGERIYLLRLEPADFRFQVAYHPGRPQSLLNWQTDTGALIVLNGGYFTESYEATALVISEGEFSGVSYGDFAGMFAVTTAGPEIRWLREHPYDPEEPLLAGLQSFPLLIKPGGVLGFPDEAGDVAQRSVVAQDRAGRILFLVTAGRTFTLHELAKFLVASDLELDVALNLDGGLSAGVVLAEPAESISPLAYVPAVIVVYPAP
jgi:hypothetical protein